MEKKDYLFEVTRKTGKMAVGLLACLGLKELLALGLCAKRYYCLVAPLLAALVLDYEQETKQTSKANRNNKNSKKNKKDVSYLKEAEEQKVNINSLPFWKWGRATAPEQIQKWQRIQHVEMNSPYLQKKLKTKTDIFYRHSETGQLMYVNRSLVDPSLDYNRGGFDSDLFREQLYEDIYYNQGDFISQQALLQRQRELLKKIQAKKAIEEKAQSIDYTQSLLKLHNMKRLALILCFGGSFSFAIYEQGNCVMHKSDRKYVCRKKAGERQLNRDKQNGNSIKSMGSQIRREQEKRHIINVSEILLECKQQLQECEIILLQAPGLNRLFVINEDENLDGLQDRLRSMCLTAKKANFTQLQTMYEWVSKVNFITPHPSKTAEV